MRKFKQINYRDRVTISRLKANGFSISEIARRTGFHKSSLSREFKRNCTVDNDHDFWAELYAVHGEKYEAPEVSPGYGWVAETAQQLKVIRTSYANSKRHVKSKTLKHWAIRKLKSGWSPEQIAGRSKIDGPGSVSHECVYQWIKKDKKQGGSLYQKLKRFGKRKQRFNRRDYADLMPGRVSIDKRPRVVDKRNRLGDLEADLIVGFKADSYVLTVIDRVSRRVRLEKIRFKNKHLVLSALKKALVSFNEKKTLTVDNGREFALHREVAKQCNLKVYFTHPYTSQEKGTVENTNGLIRYYLPKKSGFRKISDKKLLKIEATLNQRPRKILAFRTPNEIQSDKYLLRKLIKSSLQL